jgi:hypothetical protein
MIMPGFQKPAPLKIKCTSSDCEHDLHCFKAHKKMAPADRGKCRSCNADLINWDRVHCRNLKDVRYTFEALKHELIRHHHFEKKIDEKAIRHARRKGRPGLIAAARIRLERYLAPAKPPRDGRQTPFKDNAIFYAQHATACCCRACLEYWHGIPKGRPLTQEELEYCLALATLFFEQRLPNLKDEPEKVPPLRRPKGLEPEESHP